MQRVNPLYSLSGVEVSWPPWSGHWVGQALQAISNIMRKKKMWILYIFKWLMTSVQSAIQVHIDGLVQERRNSNLAEWMISTCLKFTVTLWLATIRQASRRVAWQIVASHALCSNSISSLYKSSGERHTHCRPSCLSLKISCSCEACGIDKLQWSVQDMR